MANSINFSDLPSPTEMNKDFLIRWRRADETSSFDKLIGAGKYATKFGEDYMRKHFGKAINHPERKLEVRIRGKYIITFIYR